MPTLLLAFFLIALTVASACALYAFLWVGGESEAHEAKDWRTLWEQTDGRKK